MAAPLECRSRELRGHHEGWKRWDLICRAPKPVFWKQWYTLARHAPHLSYRCLKHHSQSKRLGLTKMSTASQELKSKQARLLLVLYCGFLLPLLLLSQNWHLLRRHLERCKGAFKTLPRATDPLGPEKGLLPVSFLHDKARETVIHWGLLQTVST